MDCTWGLARIATLHPVQLFAGAYAKVVLASQESRCLRESQRVVPDRMFTTVMSIGESVQSGAARSASSIVLQCVTAGE